MALIDRLFRRREPELRSAVELFQSWTGANPKEKLEDDFRSYVEQGYKSNGVLFAVILARMSLFSEVRFAFRNKLTKDIFGTPALALLENPWENGTTGELLSRMEQDVSLSGNAYIFKAGPGELQRLRPDWVEILTDRRHITGYVYTPGGPQVDGGNAEYLLPEWVAHWSPIPDPMAAFRGMSWVTTILMELQSDVAMTKHKQMFFERAATPNLLIKSPKKLSEESQVRLRDQLQLRHEGVENAYRTMVLEDGADAMVVGAGMQAISFDTIQAAGENRIAAAGNVPGIVAGLKEGLQAATYSNYAQAVKKFETMFARPQWRSVCSCLEHLVSVPGGAELWYDASDIAALQSTELDAATILQMKSVTAVNLVRAGYEGEAVAKVVDSGEGFDTMPHTGEIYFPGAQAYTAPGESPSGVPGDVSPNKPAPLPANGAKALPPGRMRVIRDVNGLFEELVYENQDEETREEAAVNGAE